jgi:hypothetical protein
MKIWCEGVACCIPKATSTPSEYVIIVFPPQKMVAPVCNNTTFIRTLP